MSMEFFSMYRAYMGEFKLAMKTLSSYEENSAQFREIMKILQYGPLCERLNLPSYLLTPVQRLPRYELLLKELLKHTPHGHPDEAYIEEALNLLHKELTKLNLSIKSCQLACSDSKSSSRIKSSSNRKRSRRPTRTMSVLRKFVSVATIEDYSSVDSSFTDDMVKAPRITRRARRSSITHTAPHSSYCTDSDLDLSASAADEDTNTSPVSLRQRRHSLMSYKAASCSDLLLEFTDRKPVKTDLNFHMLTPLASATCTPNSSHPSILPGSQRNSLYSSNSSLSSSPHCSEREEGSVTPTEANTFTSVPLHSSTPMCSNHDNSADDQKDKDSTLKSTRQNVSVSGTTSSEQPPTETTTKETSDGDKKKTTWKRLFKSAKKSGMWRKSEPSPKELKYIHQPLPERT